MPELSRSADFIIVGAGIAGLRAAITLAAHGRVLAITKEQLGESNTSYAQGGIAVALSGADDVEQHWADTLAAGDGLVDREAAHILVAEGPARVDELLRWGTGFDRHAGTGELLLTREGAHSRNRILHANGDATGAEIGRALLAHARTHPAIELLEWTTCTDLIRDEGGRVAGVELLGEDRQRTRAWARAVLLASGGAGQVYSDTTNPAVATGDGIAAAFRAGAAIADMEFYQFHPTALSLPGVARFLLSEALRGEGAWLLNEGGERFMERYHPLLELAPRDVVARAITREGMGAEGQPRPVYLDMRHVAAEHPGQDLAVRFPGISAFLARHGLLLSRDPIPVRPAAHYLMGGVETDGHGRTSLPGLYAAGEVACTGVHGANRLASNSLLEGLVFGARAAEAMLAEPPAARVTATRRADQRATGAEDARELRHALQSIMWRDAGLLRDAGGLLRARACLREVRHRVQGPAAGNGLGNDGGNVGGNAAGNATREAVELGNLLDVSQLIVRSALAREESRGGHFRNDFPRRDDRRFALKSHLAGEGGVEFRPRSL